ncbi:RecX family transcriptional regulator [Candidatus Amarolinea aalborgensis]|jgi:regulatory protein|uniref:RecX family transcriptional regulator n=1 Tax=Candidatus Amarolinea aalborgensis TaxID=2249329 RepID=UPI003BF9F02A
MGSKTITALVFQKTARDRVNVFLDEVYAFGLAAILAAPLRVGQVLSEQEIDALRAADLEEHAWNLALKFLSFRPRSEVEIRRYLAGKGLDAAATDQIIERLVRLGYVDDQAFARAWVASRSLLRPKGPRALQYELRSKGVAPDVIEEALEDLAADEAAYAAVSKPAARWRALESSAFKQKVQAFLARRGFDYDIIQKTVERLLAEVDPAGAVEHHSENRH